MSQQKALKFGRKPNSFIYNVLGIGIAVNLSRLIFGIHIRKNKKVSKMEGPLVCIGTHPSYLDPIIMAAALGGRKINFVAGAFLFRNRLIAPLFAAGGCIPKVQFRSDSRAVKAMLTVLNNKGTLGIFPEGTRFVDGTSIPFDDALARMIKKTSSGIAFLETHGAYSTWPRWSNNSFRRGRIEGEVKRVLSAKEVEAMTVSQLHQFMQAQLKYNEYDWLLQHPHTYKSKALADGVHNVAHACPRCCLDNIMKAEKNMLFCSNCGNRVLMDKSGFFHPVSQEDKCFDNLHLWKNWQMDRMRKRVSEPGFFVEEATRLLLPWGEYEYKLVGQGTVKVQDGQVIYCGTECVLEDGIIYNKKTMAKDPCSFDIDPAHGDLNVTKTFAVHKIRGISADYGLRFELIENGGQINRFLLHNGQRVLEMQMAIQAMQELE